MKGSIRFGIGLIVIMVAVGDHAMSLVSILGIATIGLILLFSGANALKTNNKISQNSPLL
jgi:hypothetical protein